MEAIRFERFGGPEVLQLMEVADPVPATGQVLVTVAAVGINPIDWKIRSGAMGGELPKGTGIDVAGTVRQLGPDVPGVALGDRVFGFAVGGGAAELALLAGFAVMPPALDFAAAAALPVSTEAAARSLDLLGITEGSSETLLINGASGAVGTAAVQLARLRGARVIGTAGEGNHDRLRALGAEPVTYGPGLAERVRALSPTGVDAALDAFGGGVLPVLVELTGTPRRVVTIADFQGAAETGAIATGGPTAEPAAYALDLAAELAGQGRFSIPVAATFPLGEIGRAHALSETGHADGKLVVLL